MGGRNARMKGPGLANYGGGYDPYNNYGEIENYGSFYQPTGGDPYGYGFTDGPLITSVRPPLGGLGGYGLSYPAGFNPAIEPGLGGVKVRQICVPNHIVGAFQNLLQQGGMAGCGAPQIAPQMPCAPPPMMPQMPIMPQMPCAPPPIMPQMPIMPQIPCAPPPMIPQMPIMPQMPCAPPPMIPQMPFAPPPVMPQLGSNCCSMSIQLPSVAPQMPLPMMPQMPIAPSPMRKIFFF